LGVFYRVGEGMISCDEGAAPWYAALTARVGPVALDQLFLRNSVRRAVERGATPDKPFWYYPTLVWESSRGFRYALPAVVCGLAAAAAGWNRRAWGLLLLPTLAFTLAVSSAATKHPHYLYPVFPCSASRRPPSC
jgi:hypothetical protein